MREPDFFVGYVSKVPRHLAVFSLGCGLALLALFALAALSLGRGADAAAAGVAFDGADATLEGVVETVPYPLLRLPDGHAVLLAGDGKRGGQEAARALEGRQAKASGYMLKRGDLDMLVLGELAASPAPAAPVPAPQQLGRWRLGGEICDGKCAAGAMHPGAGLSHKACASLCIRGGLAPVLVLGAPFEGRSFVLLADEAGGPVPGAALDLVALPVELEGMLERRGDLLLLRVDWPGARRL